jgi:predicted anti-sigma-YlaC factor YlaD
MSCENYRTLLPAYLDDSLDEVRRTGFRSHLRACESCRSFALAEEPTLIFALGGRSETPPEQVETCVAAVVSGIRRDRLELRLRRTSRRWLAAAAAVVIALVTAGAWWLRSDRSIQPMQADALEIAPQGGPVVADEAPAPVEPPPRVEVEMTEKEVRVYQYAIEDDASTGAVFIVNPGMEL